MTRTLSILCVLGLTVPAVAAPPEDPAAAAERLHEQAVAEAKRGQWPQAIRDWEAATALHVSWKYALNLASAYAFRKEWMPAWEALDRARGLDLPADRREAWTRLRDQIEAELLGTYAWIELSVEPPDATVLRGGEVWRPPLRAWVKSPLTQVRVHREGYAADERGWSHPVGGRYARTIRLVPTASAAREVRLIEDEAGRSERDPELVALDAPATFGAWKWTLVASAAATLAVGAGLVGWSEQLSSDASDLNAHPPDKGAYDAEYDRLQERYRASRIAGWTLTGVGGALGVAAAVLFVLDGRDPRDAALTAAPLLLPGGGGFVGVAHF